MRERKYNKTALDLAYNLPRTTAMIENCHELEKVTTRSGAEEAVPSSELARLELPKGPAPPTRTDQEVATPKSDAPVKESLLFFRDESMTVSYPGINPFLKRRYPRLGSTKLWLCKGPGQATRSIKALQDSKVDYIDLDLITALQFPASPFQDGFIINVVNSSKKFETWRIDIDRREDLSKILAKMILERIGRLLGGKFIEDIWYFVDPGSGKRMVRPCCCLIRRPFVEIDKRYASS